MKEGPAYGVWLHISEKHINQLEECDKIFMRRLFELEQGTPVEGCFLETSVLPLRYIIMGRQLIFTENVKMTLLKKFLMPNKKGLHQCKKLEDLGRGDYCCDCDYFYGGDTKSNPSL